MHDTEAYQHDSASLRHRPRHSLEQKLLLWTVALVVVPTFVCVVFLNRITQRAMTEHHARNVAVLGQTIASSLATQSGETLIQSAKKRLQVLNLDQRTAFVGVMDKDHRLIYRRAIDAEAWTKYRRWLDNAGNEATAEVGQPIVLGNTGELIVHKVPIVNPPMNVSLPIDEDTGEELLRREIEGYVLMGIEEPALPATLQELHATLLTAASLVCLICVPLVIWFVRKITNPIRGLVDASLHLATGGTPDPIESDRHDEVGLLAEAFNFMAGKLVSARSLLQVANEELECKVKERTAELQRLNEQLEITAKQFESMAATDPLTGLHNRRAFGDALSRAVSEALRYDEELACIMIDLDGFKQLNDTLGHQKGDDLLEIAARALQLNCRGSDVAGRFGGDEFVLLLPRADELTARRVAERVQDCFDREIMPELEGTPLAGKVTMSLGLATLAETAVTDPEQLLAKADHALYRAKERGKNRLEIYRRGTRQADFDFASNAMPT